jgi:hypothetical protein
MVLNDYIQQLIQSKVGDKLTVPSQFDILSHDIFQVTGKMLGVNTLKRLFGKLPDVNTTPGTLAILAEYLGYSSWDAVEKVALDANSQLQELNNMLLPKELPEGTTFTVTYEPGRKLHLQVLADKRCLVLESAGGKIVPGDVLDIADITVGSTFVANQVERGGRIIGKYLGGKEGGVKTLQKDKKP